MSIQHWDPFRETLSLREAMSRLLEESVVGPASLGSGTGLGLALDLEEAPDEYTVRAALPGLRPEEINVEVLDDTLTIQAERRGEEERRDRNYLVRERRVGAITRTIRLPQRVDADKVQARYEHGELVLTLPKAAGSAARRITIGGQGQQLTGGTPYQYGYDAAGSDQYRGREFEDVESNLRSEYERRHRAAGGGISGLWERFREEIRTGWNRARGK